MANLEQEIADRVSARYGIANDTALDIVQDVIDIYELKDQEYADLFVKLIRDYNHTFGETSTYMLLMHHLNIDENEARKIYERII